MLLLIDIDNTLANHEHRAHLVTGNNRNWKEFLQPYLVAQDIPIVSAQKCLPNLLKHITDYKILTCRGEALRDTTVAWLSTYFPCLSVTEDTLLMRTERCRASVHKKKVVLEILQAKKYRDMPIILLDDDPYVLSRLSKYIITMRAPECWEVLWNEEPKEAECLFRR